MYPIESTIDPLQPIQGDVERWTNDVSLGSIFESSRSLLEEQLELREDEGHRATKRPASLFGHVKCKYLSCKNPQGYRHKSSLDASLRLSLAMPRRLI
jgi:hypothetical protein